jgi:hypothetical protein
VQADMLVTEVVGWVGAFTIDEHLIVYERYSEDERVVSSVLYLV